MRALALVAALAVPAGAEAASIDGIWVTEDGDAVVWVGPCADGAAARCGVLVGLAAAPWPAELREALCQLAILWDLAPEDGGVVWSGGRILDPETERTYPVEVRRDGARLRLRAGGAVVGETFFWTPAPAHLPAC